jgi:2-haloacid dehalogenase
VPDVIKLVAFDLYETLLDPEALVPLLRDYSPMPEAMRDAWHARQLQLTNANVPSRYVDFDRITLNSLLEIAPRFHVKLEALDIKKMIDGFAALPPFGDVAHALCVIAKKRVPIVCVSNAVASTARNALTHAGIGDRFGHIFSADTVKTYKPKRAIYDQVTALGVLPEEILYVTSADWDAIGAKQAGFHTVWVDRKRSNLTQRSERTLYDLTELEMVINEEYDVHT